MQQPTRPPRCFYKHECIICGQFYTCRDLPIWFNGLPAVWAEDEPEANLLYDSELKPKPNRGQLQQKQLRDSVDSNKLPSCRRGYYLLWLLHALFVGLRFLFRK